MGAFNWIIVKTACPKCKRERRIRCQTHVASDYDGDDTGRFHDREYKIGEKMAWWPKKDPRYARWRVLGIRTSQDVSEEYDFECCYSECQTCKSDLYAAIKFKELVPIEVLEVGLEANWPAQYRR